jgi:hypothetical protein
MSYQKPSKRQKCSGPASQSQQYGNSMASSNNATSESVQHPSYPTAPAAILASSSGNSDPLGSTTNWPGNMHQGQAPQHDGQAQQRQLISEILNAAMRSSGSRSTNQQAGPSSSAQVLLTQLQSMIGTTKTPNELLLQQLQQLIQPQPHLSEAPGASRSNIPNTESSIESDLPAEPDERKLPAPCDKGASQAEATGEAQASAMVPCRARGMPPEHNASVSFPRRNHLCRISLFSNSHTSSLPYVYSLHILLSLMASSTEPICIVRSQLAGTKVSSFATVRTVE